MAVKQVRISTFAVTFGGGIYPVQALDQPVDGVQKQDGGQNQKPCRYFGKVLGCTGLLSCRVTRLLLESSAGFEPAASHLQDGGSILFFKHPGQDSNL